MLKTLQIIGYAFYVMVTIFWAMIAITMKNDHTAPAAIPGAMFVFIVLPLTLIIFGVFIRDMITTFRDKNNNSEGDIFTLVRLFITPSIALIIIASFIIRAMQS